MGPAVFGMSRVERRQSVPMTAILGCQANSSAGVDRRGLAN